MRVTAETSLSPVYPAAGATIAIAVSGRVILYVVRVKSELWVDIDTQIVYPW